MIAGPFDNCQWMLGRRRTASTSIGITRSYQPESGSEMHLLADGKRIDERLLRHRHELDNDLPSGNIASPREVDRSQRRARFREDVEVGKSGLPVHHNIEDPLPIT